MLMEWVFSACSRVAVDAVVITDVLKGEFAIIRSKMHQPQPEPNLALICRDTGILLLARSPSWRFGVGDMVKTPCFVKEKVTP